MSEEQFTCVGSSSGLAHLVPPQPQPPPCLCQQCAVFRDDSDVQFQVDNHNVTFTSVFEYVCHTISECIECNEHGDSGCGITYTLDIENNLSFLSLFLNIYDG